jgi:hypothetical protein
MQVNRGFRQPWRGAANFKWRRTKAFHPLPLGVVGVGGGATVASPQPGGAEGVATGYNNNTITAGLTCKAMSSWPRVAMSESHRRYCCDPDRSKAHGQQLGSRHQQVTTSTQNWYGNPPTRGIPAWGRHDRAIRTDRLQGTNGLLRYGRNTGAGSVTRQTHRNLDKTIVW